MEHSPIGIIGATGNVGRMVVQQLLDEGLNHLFLAASHPTSLTVKDHDFPVYTVQDLPPCLIYILVTEADVSRHYAPLLLKREFKGNKPFVLDSSSAFRLDPEVPLLSPLINHHLITPKNRLYAHANCVASPLSLVLAPLREWEFFHIYVSTYQSISGAGWGAMNEFKQATQDHLYSRPSLPQNFPRSCAFNAFPEIGTYDGQGATGEEAKIAAEVHKILNISVPIHVTSVRIPTLQGHGITLAIHFARDFSIKEVQEKLARAPGIILSSHGYHSPAEVIGSDEVFVGRLRQASPVYPSLTHLHCWVCSDNLRRGASTDLVETALYILDFFKE